MRARILLLLISLALLTAAAPGQQLLSRSSDTLWIDSIATHSGQNAVLSFGFANADTVNAIDLPLTYHDPDILVDSVSFVGSRIESDFFTVVTIDTAKAICHIGAFLDFEPDARGIGSGSGLFARLYLQIPDEYPTTTIGVDTIRLQTGLTFVDAGNQSYVPVFVPGIITNTYTPALDDSMWVNDVDVSSGEQFIIPVNLYNEHPVYNIRLPLEYSSDNILFDSLTITGTRATQAVLADAIADNVGKRLLLSLGFDAGDLLPPGTGPVANLHFTCTTTDGTSSVPLDTTDQYLSSYYVQLGPLFEYVKTYPRYVAGTITIDLSTDADDRDQLSLPGEYRLEQNAPNPFNPTTTIAFALPERSHVTLEIFNILGQNVRTLIDKTMSAGRHTVTFDSRDDHGGPLASGIYLYRIRTMQFTQSRKMILLK